jgi:UDP-N-acetylmuramate: L-alanyl-gamma-D-glutamyl-meso-diaminopimelate ligase
MNPSPRICGGWFRFHAKIAFMNSRAYYLEKRNALEDAPLRDIKEYSFTELDNLKIKKIHFTAVCGKAMASLAGMLVEAGYEVTGSDNECYPPMSDVIAESGVCYLNGYDPKNLRSADVVIIGNACPVNNIEAEEARRIGKPQLSIASALHYFFIRNKKSIVITGTHGKTTTTSYLAQVLDSLEQGTSFMVGGVLKSTNKSYAFNKNSKYIVVEGDEYDSVYFDKRPKFFHYDPHVLIITSIEFDHADIYSDFEDYKNAFRMLLAEKKSEGVTIACIDDPTVAELVKNYQGNLITYGIENEQARINAKIISIEGNFQTCEIWKDNELYTPLEIPIFGNHNIHNALSVFATLNFLGYPKETIVSEMKKFSGVKQRQEVLEVKNGITVVDDYAHHPTAVRETLLGLRKQYPNQRIVAVFEPRSTTSRKKMYEHDYKESFGLADIALIKEPSLRTQDNPEDFLSASVIGEAYKTIDELVTRLKEITKSNDVVVFMSNGSFDEIQQKFLDII